MRTRLNSKYVKAGLTGFCVVAGGILFYYLVFHSANLRANIRVIGNILMPVMFGLGMGYLLTPVLNFLECRVLTPLCNRLKIKKTNARKRLIRGLSILLTVCLFFSLICGLIGMLLSQIVPSIQNIIANFDTYLANITSWLNNLLANNAEIRDFVVRNVSRYSSELEGWINNTLLTKSSELIKTVSLSIIGMLKVFWNFILGFIISIYVLASKETFAGQAKKIAYALFHKDTANILINNFRFVHKTFIGFVGGKILDSILIGLICFACTSIMNTPYAALVSLVIGITNVIPFFGPFLGAIPTTILIFVVDPGHPLNCVYYIVFILVLQQFDGNILGPKILGNSTGIAGFWVIFAITFFGGLFGVLGMIIGVPFFAVIFAFIKSFVNSALRRKDMPESTSPYMDVGLIDDQGVYHKYMPESKVIRGDPVQKGFTNHYACTGERMYSSTDDIRLDQKAYEKRLTERSQNQSKEIDKEETVEKEGQKEGQNKGTGK